MDRTTITKMGKSLRAFSRKRSLLKMTREELANMPKEVMIACAPKEIALVWENLPTHLHDDIDILKYQYCTEHYIDDSSEDVDVNDGPPPRRLICCLCNMEEVEIASKNSVKVNPSTDTCEEVFDNCCCCTQQ